MTDLTYTANINNNDMLIPKEIINLISSHLTIPELARFKQACQLFNHAEPQVYFLQPFYNRLHNLDKTLPAILTQENSTIELKKAFEKIKDRQNQEIVFLNNKYPLQFRDNLNSLLNSSSDTIQHLEKRSLLLDNLNIEIISKKIATKRHRELDLSFSITRLIITEDNIDTFRSLKSLNCSYTLLIALNVQDCTRLRNLRCMHTPLTSLNLQNHPTLRDLRCDNNQLTSLNLQNCTALQQVSCQKNKLITLNLQGCATLYTLYCCRNLLTSLSLQDSPRLGTLYCNDNPLITLNLEGCARLKELECNSDQLISLNAKDASQVTHDKYFSLEEKLLFTALSCAAWSERSEIIEKLGKRYNALNCFNYDCFYDVGVISSQTANSIYDNFYAKLAKVSSFLPSFSRMTQEDKQKREHENIEPKTKKLKTNPVTF